MNPHSWRREWSTEVEAPMEFAWEFWTDVANWRKLEPGVEFRLDGLFEEGTRGQTVTGGQAQDWKIVALDPGCSWTIEMALGSAALMIGMQFAVMGRQRTIITQRLWLEGEAQQPVLDAVRMFEATTPDGLKRIGKAIELAWEEHRGSG